MKRIIPLLVFTLVSLSAYAQDYRQQARVLLEKNLVEAQLRSADEVRITDAYPNKSSGTFMVYIQQLYQDIPVSNAVKTLVFKNGMLVNRQGDFIGRLEGSTRNGLASLTPAEAVNRALAHLKLPQSNALSSRPIKSDPRLQEFTFQGTKAVEGDIPVKLLWIPEPDGSAVLSWEVGVSPVDTSAVWLVRVEANSGRIVNKVNLTVYCNWGTSETREAHAAHQHAGARSIPESRNSAALLVNDATYKVLPFPAESPQHAGGAFTTVANPWNAAGAGNQATTLKWHNDGNADFNYSRGNNVHAQEDADANNGAGTPATSSTALPALTFTDTFDPATPPTTATNQAAAITNLFYWNNIVHDVMYQYGFDEVSGNFQNSNIGRGGLGGDYVMADAHDGSGTNNANFSTQPDGIRPRMQMYLFNAPPGGSINRDGDLDNGIIVHEYGHGISNRLTGGPSQVTCLQNDEQMGEGWSDYYALMLTTDWGNTATTSGPLRRPIGTYAIGQATTGSGIRTYPYTTDMAVNPFTYANVASSSSVHYRGSIWATMLWDMTWEIIRETNSIGANLYDPTHVGGNTVALRLVTEGLKLQPCSPGFVDGRNAILEADTLLYGGQYSCAIWRAFARRGLGFSASQGSSASISDQIPAFDTPAITKITKMADLTAAATGQEVTYTLNVSCRCQAIANYIAVDSLAANATYVSGGSYNAGAKTVSFGNISLNPGQDTSLVIKVIANETFDNTLHFASTADALTPWTSATLTGTTVWSVSSDRSKSPANSWFFPSIKQYNTVTLTSPAYTLYPGNTELSFQHYLDLEKGYDGGAVEITTDNGATWQDLEPYFVLNGYNATISSCCGTALSGRRAFSGFSGGFIKTVANLSTFGAQTIRIRFLAAEDNIVKKEGWYIDDILLKTERGISNRAYLFNGTTLVAQDNLFTPIVLSRTISSVGTGNWNSAATWSCGCVPLSADVVTINPSHTVTIDGLSVHARELVMSGGNLQIVNNGQLQTNN